MLDVSIPALNRFRYMKSHAQVCNVKTGLARNAFVADAAPSGHQKCLQTDMERWATGQLKVNDHFFLECSDLLRVG